MDYCSKLYIDYLSFKNIYYYDMPVEEELLKVEEKFKKSLSEEQMYLYDDLVRVQKKLRAYKDLHLIEYVVKQYEK